MAEGDAWRGGEVCGEGVSVAGFECADEGVRCRLRRHLSQWARRFSIRGIL